MLSAGMSAQVGPLPTDPPTIEARHETFPLTPTGDSTTRPRSDAPRIRSVSASTSEADALEAFRQSRADNEYDRLVGQTLDGRYFVEKKIGEGGMGVVFSARHAVIERPLAIKVLKREVMRDTGTIQRFVREAKAASRIGHPNIVDVTDFGTTPDGMTYSVMEFIEGVTLGAALRAAAPFPAHRAVKIAAQMARALGAAHDKGIVHRDLKPENVFLLDRDGRTDFVKIVDFGIAKVIAVPGSTPAPNEPRLTRAGSVFGTPEYMAPEQAAGRSDTDGRVDIYALGIILYEMTTGRVPFRGETTVRTLAMQMLDVVEPPSKVRPDLTIAPELEQVIMMALTKKREQRYQTMGEMLTALEKLLTLVGQSVTGSPIYALSPLPPGADPDPGQHGSMPVFMPGSMPPSAPTAPPRRAKSRTKRHEPEFVTQKPPTFEHVWTETELPTPARRWPLILLGVIVLGGAAAALALLATKGDREHGPTLPGRDAGLAVVPVPPDAQIIAPDAEVIAVVDASIPADARETQVTTHRDAGPRVMPGRVDAGGTAPVIPETPNGRGTVIVEISTRPENAQLFEGSTYKGPGGVHVEESMYARKTYTCRLRGYKDGTVTVYFDGRKEFALCELERIVRCVDGLHNPIDGVCPEPTPGAR